MPLFAAGDRGLLTRREMGRVTAPPVAAAWGSSASPWSSSSARCWRCRRSIPGSATFYDRTVKSQLDRTSPFSVWGQDHSLEWLQTAFKAFAVALALVVAFLPRRRSLPQVAALAAAVMIAVEITAEHWFYLYIPWFFGLLLVGLTAFDQGVELTDGDRELGRERARGEPREDRGERAVVLRAPGRGRR